MASHGRRGVAGVLLGSETQKVLAHAKVPVLVYRYRERHFTSSTGTPACSMVLCATEPSRAAVWLPRPRAPITIRSEPARGPPRQSSARVRRRADGPGSARPVGVEQCPRGCQRCLAALLVVLLERLAGDEGRDIARDRPLDVEQVDFHARRASRSSWRNASRRAARRGPTPSEPSTASSTRRSGHGRAGGHWRCSGSCHRAGDAPRVLRTPATCPARTRAARRQCRT